MKQRDTPQDDGRENAATTRAEGSRGRDARQPSERVIDAVAETTGKDPTEMQRLYDIIDPDALDRLYRTDGPHQSREVHTTFQFEGCTVTVDADGHASARLDG
jgi:hypothetical protein